MKLAYLLAIFVLLTGCASKSNRVPAGLSVVQRGGALDNDGKTWIDPGLETAAPNEEQEFAKVAALISQFVTQQRQTLANHIGEGGHKSIYSDLNFGKTPGVYGTRDVHRKSTGCMTARLHFFSDTLERLDAQISDFRRERNCDDPAHIRGVGPCPQALSSSDLGVFIPGKTYDAVVRYSNGNPDNQNDRDPDARGMAVKILPRGSVTFPLEANNAVNLNRATLLDILGINFPTFFTSDPLKYLEATRSFFESARNFEGKVPMKFYQALSVFGSNFTVMERRLALAVNGSVIASPLFQDYYSMVPSRLGPFGKISAVKYHWQPVACSARETARFDKQVAVYEAPWTQYRLYSSPVGAARLLFLPPYRKNYSRDYLRRNANQILGQESFCYNLVVQLYRDQVSTNIEDATDFWPSTRADQSWWEQDIVPKPWIWRTGPGSRAKYLAAFERKHLSPGIAIAQLTIPQYPLGYKPPEFNTKTCEDLSFNPWNGRIDYHKPLGIISRLKRRAYDASRTTRFELNGIDPSTQER